MKAEEFVVHDDGTTNRQSIVFVNGFPLSRLMWAKPIEEIGEKIRCVSYDLRGFGDNRTIDGVVPIERHADDLLELIDRLKLVRPVICGHSFGGFVALRAAVRDHERLGGLAVCGAHAKHPTDAERLFWAKRIATMDERGASAFLADYLRNCLSQDTLDQPGGPYDLLLEQACSQEPATLKAAMLAIMGRTDTLHALEEQPLPFMILGGEDDVQTPPEALLRMGLGIVGAQFVRVPNASHMAPVDNPEFTASALIRFMESDAVQERLPPVRRGKR